MHATPQIPIRPLHIIIIKKHIPLPQHTMPFPRVDGMVWYGDQDGDIYQVGVEVGVDLLEKGEGRR